MKIIDVVLVSIQFILIILFFIIPTGLAAGLFFQTLAFVLTVSGIVVVLAASFELGNALTPFPTPNNSNSLVTTGIYKHIRHPIYSGLLLVLSGVSLFSLNIPRGILTVVIFFYFYFKSQYEEKLLIAKFKNYKEYLNKTGKFFPKLI